MKKARIAELKNNLSRYLEHVRGGGSVLVLDRDRPIAQLAPLTRTVSTTGAVRERLKRLEHRGLIRRGGGDRGAAAPCRAAATPGDVGALVGSHRGGSGPPSRGAHRRDPPAPSGGRTSDRRRRRGGRGRPRQPPVRHVRRGPGGGRRARGLPRDRSGLSGPGGARQRGGLEAAPLDLPTSSIGGSMPCSGASRTSVISFMRPTISPIRSAPPFPRSAHPASPPPDASRLARMASPPVTIMRGLLISCAAARASDVTARSSAASRRSRSAA